MTRVIKILIHHRRPTNEIPSLHERRAREQKGEKRETISKSTLEAACAPNMCSHLFSHYSFKKSLLREPVSTVLAREFIRRENLSKINERRLFLENMYVLITRTDCQFGIASTCERESIDDDGQKTKNKSAYSRIFQRPIIHIRLFSLYSNRTRSLAHDVTVYCTLSRRDRRDCIICAV